MRALGYGNMLIRETNDDYFTLTFKDTSFFNEISELIKQAPVDFTSMRVFSGGGIMISGKGFLFLSLEEAQNAAEKIVENVYKKHGD